MFVQKRKCPYPVNGMRPVEELYLRSVPDAKQVRTFASFSRIRRPPYRRSNAVVVSRSTIKAGDKLASSSPRS